MGGQYRHAALDRSGGEFRLDEGLYLSACGINSLLFFISAPNFFYAPEEGTDYAFR